MIWNHNVWPAWVAGGICERASGAAEPAREFASGEADSSPILSRLRYQNKNTRARNTTSYAGY